jgi:peptidoglycan hydrolase-like protein with peptidoglycan-binding domain
MKLKKILNAGLAVLTAAAISAGSCTPALASSEASSETVPEMNARGEAQTQSEAGETETIRMEIPGTAFDSQKVYEDDDFTVSIRSEDEDASDGCTWSVHMENRSDNQVQIQFLNMAVNNVMCPAQYGGNPSWTVEAGGAADQQAVWTKESLKNAKMEDTASIRFTLGILSSSSDQTSSIAVYQPYELDVSGKEIPQTQTPEAKDVIAYNDDVIFEILSYGEDSSGFPFMNVYMENHTDSLCMFDLSDVLIGDYSVEPDWSQAILPDTAAYSTISFFTLDSVNDTGDVSKIDFNLRLWKAVPSAPGSFTQWEQFNASVLPEITETEAVSETAALPAENVAAETTALPAENAAAETESANSVTDAAASADTEVESEPAGISLSDKVGYTFIITDLENQISEGYYSIDLYLSNNSEEKLRFSCDEIAFNDYQTNPEWTKELPAGSRVVTELLEDGNKLSSNGVSAVDKLTLRLKVSGEDGTLLSDQTYTIDTENKAVKEITDNLGTSAETLPQSGTETAADESGTPTESTAAESGAPTESTAAESGTPSETAAAENRTPTESTDSESETEAAASQPSETYEDYSTVLSVQALLSNAGYTLDKNGKTDEATQDAIAKYREAKGLSAGTQIDNELLYSLGTTDSETYKAVQAQLQALGYDVGEIDGLTGRKSREAIADFKSKQGITSDGITEELLDRLKEEAVKKGYEPGETETAETETASETESAETAETGTAAVNEASSETEGSPAKTYEDHDTVLSVQALLRNNNYSVEKTGEPDDATRSAIADYRSARGLKGGSDIDDELLYSLGYTDSETYRTVQEELKQLGYDIGDVDGLTGRKSREALEDFKKKHNFTDSGLTKEILDELEKEAVRAGYTVKKNGTEN